MHGVREELLVHQAESIGLPLKEIWLPEKPSMDIYDQVMKNELSALKDNHGIRHAIFGDIFLEDLRKYREDKLKEVGMTGVFPLWKNDTKDLVNEFISLGFKAVIVCVDERFLDHSFVGRIIDRDFVNDLPSGVDPCGENGEFHSFVYEGPILAKTIPFTLGEVVYRQYDDPAGGKRKTGFWYQDLLPSLPLLR